MAKMSVIAVTTLIMDKPNGWLSIEKVSTCQITNAITPDYNVMPSLAYFSNLPNPIHNMPVMLRFRISFRTTADRGSEFDTIIMPSSKCFFFLSNRHQSPNVPKTRSGVCQIYISTESSSTHTDGTLHADTSMSAPLHSPAASPRFGCLNGSVRGRGALGWPSVTALTVKGSGRRLAAPPYVGGPRPQRFPVQPEAPGDTSRPHQPPGPRQTTYGVTARPPRLTFSLFIASFSLPRS